ncbi:MAG: CotH kinase family protein [Flavobacteriales bacterium]|nr:CotH kinase family protein [Flavobacteriales bacterium]
MTRLLFIIPFLFLLTTVYGIDTLRLSFDATNLHRLDSIRSEALKHPVILPKYKVKFPAKLIVANSELAAKVRLKGDWTDHINSDKWSLRIELKEGSYHGMQRFSIQHPKTRGYFFEYLFHKILEKEGVLTTQYEFAHVFINEKYKGVYAVGEHFDESLPKRFNKKRAPIIRFDETTFWEFQEYNQLYNADINYEYPMIEEAAIIPFRKKIVWKDSVLRQQFLQARNLLHGLRSFEGHPLDEMINVKAFAKYYALSALIGKSHGLNWHNQRFYFNPDQGVLEPVAYDCWTTSSYQFNYNIGLKQNDLDTVYVAAVYFNAQLFNDSNFVANYVGYLSAYLENKKFVKLIEEIISESEQTYRALLDEYWYRVPADYHQTLESVVKIKGLMDTDVQVGKFYYYSLKKWREDNRKEAKEFKNKLPVKPFTGLGLVAFTESINGSIKKVKVRNVFHKPIIIVNTIGGEKPVKLQVKLSAYQSKGSETEIEVATDMDYLEYTVKGSNEIFKTKISLYPDYVSIGEQLIDAASKDRDGIE